MLLSRIDGSADPQVQLQSVLHAEGVWRGLSAEDQETLLLHLQAHLPELAGKLRLNEAAVEEAIEARKLRLAARLMRNDPQAVRTILAHSRSFDRQLRESDPALYAQLSTYRKQSAAHLRETHPEYAALMQEFYGVPEE